jgi:hypothetical protein
MQPTEGARLDVPRPGGVTTFACRPVPPIPAAQLQLEATKKALLAEAGMTEEKHETGL